MTTRSSASLGFKLLGTYMLVQSVGVVVNLFYTPRKPVGVAFSIYIITLLLPPVLAVAFGSVLIAKSNLLARWGVSAEEEVEEAGPAVTATQSLAFSVLGVVIFAFAIIGLVSVVSLLMTTRTVGSRVQQAVFAFRAYWPLLAGELVKLAIGAYLFIGVGIFSKFLHRIQESRMPPLTGEQKS